MQLDDLFIHSLGFQFYSNDEINEKLGTNENNEPVTNEIWAVHNAPAPAMGAFFCLDSDRKEPPAELVEIKELKQKEPPWL